jgi:hypothetical protein
MHALAIQTERKAKPTLRMKDEIEVILRTATHNGEPPLRYKDIGDRMHAKRVRHEAITECVRDLHRYHQVAITSKGIFWLRENQESTTALE